jgi:hypothetical protein
MLKDKKSLKILSPTAILGYGFPEESFMRGIEMEPDVIAVDAGSIDPGPYYLGSGVPFTNRSAVRRDLRFMVREAAKLGIPVIVGTSGGSGAMPHVDWTQGIVEEIKAELELRTNVALIYADVEKDKILGALRNGKISALPGVPELTEQTVHESANIVAQMGVEPIIDALKSNCKIILAGRAYDPAVFAAFPIMLGFDPALSIHLGKILECAAIAADPGSGSDCVMGLLQDHSFTLLPLSKERGFTRESVAAHSLYEKSDPYYLPGPGGSLNLRDVVFQEEDGGRVRVEGSRFIPTNTYVVKLEGARLIGWRTISLAGVRDPIMIRQIDHVLAAVREKTLNSLELDHIEGDIHFRVYGNDGVMGDWETRSQVKTHEIGIVIEAVSDTQKEADTICSMTRSTLLHYGYDGRISTAGNLAFPFSPSDLRAGPVYEFSIYHLMELEDQSIFRTKIIES